MGMMIQSPAYVPAPAERVETIVVVGIEDPGMIFCPCGDAFTASAAIHEPKGVRCPGCKRLHTFASLASDY